VIDIGGPFWNFDMRDIAEKTAAAPRVEVAGPLISMVDTVKLDLGDPPIIKIESPEAARALVALADLVLLDADLLADVANLSHAERVVKGGVVYDPMALIDSIR